MLKFKTLVLLSILAISRFTFATTGGIVFSDNFDTETPGLSTTSLKNWTVVNSGGSVDVLNGYPGLPCVGSTGGCLDLDGSTSIAADIVSKTLTLGAGIYTLSYQLAGSQRGDTNVVEVLFGGTSLRIITIDSSVPYTKYSDVITVPSLTSGSIEFRHAGGDNVGLLLDNVTMSMNISNPQYLGVTAIPDVNGDGVTDQALLVMKSGNYYLQTIDSATGKQLKQVVLLGKAQYLGVTAIPDVNGDGVTDQALLVIKSGNYYLQTIDGATGRQLKQVALGTATTITASALTLVGGQFSQDSQVSVLITKSTSSSVLQLFDSASLTPLRTLTLPN